MPLFPETVRAQDWRFHVKCNLYVLFDFATAPIRVWTGDGPLTREAELWHGIGRRVDQSGSPLQSIEGLQQAMNGTAPLMTLTMSGVDSRVVNAAREDLAAGEIEGHRLTIWIGFMVADVMGDVPLDDLVVLGEWTMQRPSFVGQGRILRTITLPCETIFAQRSRAPFGMLTDRDQQRRYPGDKALEFVPSMVDRAVTWPRF
jgi:hypothetical protein